MSHQQTAPSTVALLEAHPTLRRLTGQVIWYLFEEAEADPADIQAFLDRFEQLKEHTAPLIAEARDPGLAPMVRICCDGRDGVCTHCARLDGMVLRLIDEDAVRLLPPYGLGCGARAERVAPEDETSLADAPRLKQEDIPPLDDLLCGEWIFTHPWSSKGS